MFGQLSLDALMRLFRGTTASLSDEGEITLHPTAPHSNKRKLDSDQESKLPTKRDRKDSDDSSLTSDEPSPSESSDSELGYPHFDEQPRISTERAEAPTTPVLEASPIIPQLQKDEIIKRLEDAFHIKTSYKALTDITFDESGGHFASVGRPDTKHGRQQLRHVIPFSFVRELISKTIEDCPSPIAALDKLIPPSLAFARMQPGFALTASQLESKEYESIQAKVAEQHFREVRSEEGITLFFSASKQHIFSTTRKKSKAEKDFSTAHANYVKTALRDLLEEVEHDSNTSIVASEILTRLIFTIFNSAPNSCFAPEGNSSIHELRLYSSAKDCAEPKDVTYEVVTAKELQERDAIGEDLAHRIRIVNCEGSKIQKINAALKVVDKIYSDSSTMQITTARNDYNANYNYQLHLANVDIEPSYNALIAAPRARSYNPEAPSYHIAKLLYSSFDLKALENIIFSYVNKSTLGAIPVYTSAEGDHTSSYYFTDGKEAREDEIGRSTGYKTKAVFRTRECDLKTLPQKLAELFVIGAMNIKHINKEDALTKLVHLAALDHEILAREDNLHKKTFDIYHELIGSNDVVTTGSLADKFEAATMGSSEPIHAGGAAEDCWDM